MEKVLNNQERARIAISCFYILMAAYAVMLVSDVMEHRLIHGNMLDLIKGAEANDRRQIIITFIAVIAQIVVIVTFIQWFRRAYHNLHKAGVKNLNMSEGWAAGAWFVPIMNLFKPYQIMKDIWVETKNYTSGALDNTSDDDLSTITRDKSSLATVGWWWAAWISCSITANVSVQIVNRSSSFESIQFASTLSVISDVLGLVAIILGIKMIKASQLHQDKFLQAWSNNEDREFISDSEDVLD